MNLGPKANPDTWLIVDGQLYLFHGWVRMCQLLSGGTLKAEGDRVRASTVVAMRSDLTITGHVFTRTCGGRRFIGG